MHLKLNWSGKRVSNSRPQPWQGCALPTELFPHIEKEQSTSNQNGAGNESRTRDLNLGKVALYQLSYSRSDICCFVYRRRRNYYGFNRGQYGCYKHQYVTNEIERVVIFVRTDKQKEDGDHLGSGFEFADSGYGDAAAFAHLCHPFAQGGNSDFSADNNHGEDGVCSAKADEQE